MLLLFKVILFTSCFTFLWDYATEPGQILGFIGEWRNRLRDSDSWWYNIALPLGACYVCFNFWFSLFFCILLLLLGELSLIDALACVSVSHVLTQLIYKYIP